MIIKVFTIKSVTKNTDHIAPHHAYLVSDAAMLRYTTRQYCTWCHRSHNSYLFTVRRILVVSHKQNHYSAVSSIFKKNLPIYYCLISCMSLFIYYYYYYLLDFYKWELMRRIKMLFEYVRLASKIYIYNNWKTCVFGKTLELRSPVFFHCFADF